MRQQFIDFSLKWLRILIVAIAVFFIVCLTAASIIVFSRAIDVILPGSTSQTSQLSSNPHLTDAQAQQKFDEGQNDIFVANNMIAFAGAFIAISSVILALVGVFAAAAALLRVRETRDIRNLKFKFENDINEIGSRADHVEKKFDESSQNFQNLLDTVTEQARDVEDKNRILEEHLKLLDKRIEQESQKLLEAAFYYSEGSKLYRGGDNQHAIEFYLRALNLRPKNPSILERLGRAYSNLNDIVNASKYLNEALAINPEDETILRSLSLLYRSTEPEKAIEYLKSIVQKNPKASEAWDFLGLCSRDKLVRDQELIKDQTLIDEAINAHEQALAIKKRPETEFYLGILLYYSPQGDKIRAKDLMLSAYNGTLQQEHDLRIRQVWKVLIHAGVPIVNDNKDEALSVIESLKQYITTERIREGVQTHLRFLLEGTGHKDWIPEIIATIESKGP